MQRNSEITNQCAKMLVNWHFNPASAPHFGGLWEAGVKSAKYQERRQLVPPAVETHPGADGLVRVVTLKTQSGVCRRPIVKIARLPDSVNRRQGSSTEC